MQFTADIRVIASYQKEEKFSRNKYYPQTDSKDSKKTKRKRTSGGRKHSRVRKDTWKFGILELPSNTEDNECKERARARTRGEEARKQCTVPNAWRAPAICRPGRSGTDSHRSFSHLPLFFLWSRYPGSSSPTRRKGLLGGRTQEQLSSVGMQ